MDIRDSPERDRVQHCCYHRRPRSRAVGADTRLVLTTGDHPCLVSRTSGAQGRLQLGASLISSSMVISVPSRPVWIRAPVSILPRLVAPVLETPSATLSRTQSYKYELPLCLAVRVPKLSVLPHSWSIPYIPPVGSIAQRKKGPIAHQDGAIRREEPDR